MKVIEVSDVLFTPKELPFKIKFGAMSQEKLVRKCPLCVCVYYYYLLLLYFFIIIIRMLTLFFFSVRFVFLYFAIVATLQRCC